MTTRSLPLGGAKYRAEVYLPWHFRVRGFECEVLCDVRIAAIVGLGRGKVRLSYFGSGDQARAFVIFVVYGMGGSIAGMCG